MDGSLQAGKALKRAMALGATAVRREQPRNGIFIGEATETLANTNTTTMEIAIYIWESAL
eukprot:CAMPEP_0172461528 /NCGR_PEP_ID=MMETSP1065-20121228/40809_1 /TAXON_ID=265537 /ORGANISM="Amphiprora paludosa, Strain CCMP125" /LENGTH=59 /DNA_ID=CAMNT_0013216883 /DNA_START=235 /DNA_END=414 /DNA_ORIENTATION=-